MSADYTMIVLSKVQFPKDEICDLVDLYGKIMTGQYKPKSYIEHLIEKSYLSLPWTMYKDINWWTLYHQLISLYIVHGIDR